MTCDLVAEGLLKPWKRKLLSEMLENRVLIMIGYSGSDFDICPELAETTKQIQTVWLQPKANPPSANCERVLRYRRGVLVIGDLVEFLNVVLSSNIQVQPAPIHDHASSISRSFDPAILGEWRIRILDWMACGNLAEQFLPELGCAEFQKRQLRATILGHLGRYRDEIREFRAIVAMPQLTEEERLRAQIDIASTRFIYGQHLRAWWLFRQLRKKLPVGQPYTKRFQTLISERKLMMNMRPCQILSALALGR